MPPATLPDTTLHLIPPIRSASRQLVREWGFMAPTIAGTSLSPTAVHCLIEIGLGTTPTTPQLARLLRIDAACVGAAVRELLAAGYVVRPDPGPGAGTQADVSGDLDITITPAGVEALAGVNAHAETQVRRALAALSAREQERVLGGLQAYAAALQQSPPSPPPSPSLPPTTITTTTPVSKPELQAPIRIEAGYRPGILGRTLELHAEYYVRVGWGRAFEVSMAAEIGALVDRLDRPANEVWAAVLPGPGGGRVVGTLFVDGEVGVGEATMRAFIVDEAVQGMGAGRRLLEAAMGFVRARGFDVVKLWTMGSLKAACRLYESVGFVVESDEELFKWGQWAFLRRYVWRRDGASGEPTRDIVS